MGEGSQCSHLRAAAAWNSNYRPCRASTAPGRPGDLTRPLGILQARISVGKRAEPAVIRAEIPLLLRSVRQRRRRAAVTGSRFICTLPGVTARQMEAMPIPWEQKWQAAPRRVTQPSSPPRACFVGPGGKIRGSFCSWMGRRRRLSGSACHLQPSTLKQSHAKPSNSLQSFSN